MCDACWNAAAVAQRGSGSDSDSDQARGGEADKTLHGHLRSSRCGGTASRPKRASRTTVGPSDPRAARWVRLVVYLVGSGASYRPREETGPMFGKLAAAVLSGTIAVAVFAVIGFAIARLHHKLAGTPNGRVGKSLRSAFTSVPVILAASVQTVFVYFVDHPHG
jgi:hypothetical protein